MASAGTRYSEPPYPAVALGGRMKGNSGRGQGRSAGISSGHGAQETQSQLCSGPGKLAPATCYLLPNCKTPAPSSHPKRDTKLEMCVASAGAAQASRGKACRDVGQTRALRDA